MYQSPLHILSDLDEDISQISEPGFLLRLRKKLLAEFNLSNSTVIEINGKSYSKDEVIKTIDVLMGNPQMPMHSFIFANKKLLDFLENDTTKVRLHELKDLVVPEEIKGMLNTVLIDRMSYNLKKAFHARRFDEATELVAYAPQFSEDDTMRWHEEISKNVVNLQEHIQSVRLDVVPDMPMELDYLKKNSLAVFLNKLPVEFIDIVNSFVNTVVNTMVVYQKNNRHDKAYLYYVSTNLLKIKCDEELMQLIKGNHVVFTANYEGNTAGSSGGGEGMSAGRIIYIVIALVVIIARIATCSHRSSSSYDNYSAINNMSKIYESLQQEKSPSDEYKSYRKQVAGYKNFKAIYSHAPLIYLDTASLSGDNPYRYIIKSSSEYDYEDTSLNRVIIKNTSGLNLIVTAFNDYDARSYFFFNGIPDTLSFYPEDKISFYFGDSLAANEAPNQAATTSILKTMYEAYFIQCPDEAYNILERDYRIELLVPQKATVKKKKKKKPLPVVELSKEFLTNDSYENEKVKVGSYYRIDENASGDPPVVEEVKEMQ